MGTAREEDSLNILLEFVPGGSISSLLGKFGSFPESVSGCFVYFFMKHIETLTRSDSFVAQCSFSLSGYKNVYKTAFTGPWISSR